MMFMRSLSGWSSALRGGWRLDEEVVAQTRRRARQDTIARLAWLAWPVLLSNLVHVAVLERMLSGAVDASTQRWATQLLTAHALMAPLMVGQWFVLRWLLRRPVGRAHAWAEALACALGLGFAVLVCAIEQPVTGTVMPYVVSCALVAALLLLPPRRATALLFGAAIALVAVLGWTQPVAAQRLSSQVGALATAALCLTLSIMMWRQRASHDTLVAQLRASQDELLRQHARLEALAVRDDMTGLWNRAEFRRRTLRELALAQRHDHSTSLILLDLDRFKHINDSWGHPVGDAVLVAVAQVLRHGVRSTDEVARLGGEEFVILLPQTPLAAAQALAERLRQQIERIVCPPVTLTLTASFGVASVEGYQRLPPDQSYERLYAAADSALYAAKHHGRNRVVISEGPLLA